MYEQFTPGRNIWKKVSRWFFFTMERIAIIAVMFVITYVMIKKLYPYNISIYGVLFGLNNLILTVYLILPSPSNPNGLMYQEILRGLLKVDKAATANVIAITKKVNKGED